MSSSESAGSTRLRVKFCDRNALSDRRCVEAADVDVRALYCVKSHWGLAEIRLNHHWVTHHLRWLAFGDFLPMVQNDEAVSQLKDG
jgi:hypothetical protein